nr:basic salivary proline-rich protein 1-like [Odocoileus virginianus texanus]
MDRSDPDPIGLLRDRPLAEVGVGESRALLSSVTHGGGPTKAVILHLCPSSSTCPHIDTQEHPAGKSPRVSHSGQLGSLGTSRRLNVHVLLPLDGRSLARGEPPTWLGHTQSRAQPPEENKRKPVLGKLGTLFTAGRRRNSRNGLESPTSSNTKPSSPKEGTSSRLLERETEKSQPLGGQPRPTDACEEGSPQEKRLEPEGEHPEGCVQAAPLEAKWSPGGGSPAAAAVPQGSESDSPQLEPLEAEGETFPDATATAKQLRSSLENSSRRENAEALIRSPGEDAAPGAGGEQEPTQGSRGVPDSPTREHPANGNPGVCAHGGSPEPQGALSQAPEHSSPPPGDPPAEGSENRAGSAPVKAEPPGWTSRS